ncbi:MAG: cytochrome c biogenesis protein CcmG [Candidatus Tokpelaia sp. JSC161]|jgi:cytochrome c biogenesis protein CcmG/thiol:disulfide interchange protein DsbE|nr:MAG: cytochrome c biogenesis protein CcmG [Candidatus Tokpelaia sp. JSC161]
MDDQWYRRLKSFLFLPFFLFVVLLFLIKIASSFKMPSVLRQAPRVMLPTLFFAKEGDMLDSKKLRGHVLLVNFWGSWCFPCREEHSFLMTLAHNNLFFLIGINYKDEPENALHFLKGYGNPFDAVALDREGRCAKNWGVYGLPETFLVSKENVILYRHIGPLTHEVFRKELMPLIRKELS